MGEFLMQPWTIVWWFWTSQLLVTHSILLQQRRKMHTRQLCVGVLQRQDCCPRWKIDQRAAAICSRPMFLAEEPNRSELHCLVAMRRKYSVRQQVGLPPIHIQTKIFSYYLMMSYFYNRRRLPAGPVLAQHLQY